jgi:hypothetical protein
MKIIISESQYKRLNESLSEKEIIQNNIKEDGWNKLLKYNSSDSILSRGFDNNPFESLNLYNDLETVISKTSSNIMLFRKKPNDNLMVFNLLTKKMFINNTELWMILEDLFKLTPEQTESIIKVWLDKTFNISDANPVRNYNPKLMVIG